MCVYNAYVRLCWRQTARRFDLFIDGNNNNNNNNMITSGQNTHKRVHTYSFVY